MMRLLMLTLLCPGIALATTDRLDEAILETRQEIETALADLNQVRAEVEAAREPLAAEHATLSRAVGKKRESLAQRMEAQQYGEQQHQALAREVAALEEECRFVLTALSEYRRSLETRTSQAALQGYRAQLVACDEQLATAENFTYLPDAAKSLLQPAVTWNRQRIGGYRATGTALNRTGIEEAGTFVFIGPIIYFTGTDGVGGIVQTSFGSLNPTYFGGHSPTEQAGIARLIAGEPTAVPVDVSGGDGLKIEAAGDSLVEHLSKGGFVMVPLLLIGILALGLTIWKLVELHGMRFASTESLAEVIQHLGPDETAQALQASRALHPPLSTLIEEALTYRHASREHIEEILHERILAMVPALERHLGTLAVFGGVAPLLGLLGTVTGMIHTFDLVTIFGTGEARLLSGGISEALITTKFGLGIAIPVLLVHAFLARRVRTIVGTLENAVVRFVNALKIGTPPP
jgi:biopolymer transport protein ExbB